MENRYRYFLPSILNWLPMHCFSCVWLFRSYGLQPTRLPCPWNSPGKNTGVGMPSSRGFSQSSDWTRITGGSSIAGGFFTVEPQGKPLIAWVPWIILVQSFPSQDVFTAWPAEVPTKDRTASPLNPLMEGTRTSMWSAQAGLSPLLGNLY